MSVPKPAILVMPAHPTNTWDRLGTAFEFIVLHYVGAVSTARNNGSYYGNTPNIGASAHFFVDEHEIVSSVPLTMSAGHCGVDYSNGKAPFWNGKGTYSTNRRSIGIEMCCKKDSKGNWYIEPETVTRTVALVKWLMQEFGIPIGNVIRHYDVCWKTCPEPWVRDPAQWTAFKKRLTEEDVLDMTKSELTALVTETVRSEMVGQLYGDVRDVPDYWEGDIQRLLDMGVIDGGTPAEKNATDVNLSRTEAKMLVIMMRVLRKLDLLKEG